MARHFEQKTAIENGKIVEQGSHEELLAKNGEFAALVARQRLDETVSVGVTTMY